MGVKWFISVIVGLMAFVFINEVIFGGVDPLLIRNLLSLVVASIFTFGFFLLLRLG